MSTQDQRIICRFCGANNFAGSATCWQCTRSLTVSKPHDSSVVVQPSVQPASFVPMPGARRDDKLAERAAAAMGMLFPVIGLPIGMVFLMLDDPRKTQLGWLMIAWSVGGLVISLILSLATIGPLMALFHQFVPSTPHSLPAIPGDDSGAVLLFRYW